MSIFTSHLISGADPYDAKAGTQAGALLAFASPKKPGSTTPIARTDAGAEFNRLYGISRVTARNADLLQFLKSPMLAMQEVNEELVKLGELEAPFFKADFDKILALGFAPEEALARATAMSGRRLQDRLGLLALERPFSMGNQNAGDWNPLGVIVGQEGSEAADVREFQRYGAAVKATGMGVAGGIGKKGRKGRKKRKLKKKLKKLRGKLAAK